MSEEKHTCGCNHCGDEASEGSCTCHGTDDDNHVHGGSCHCHDDHDEDDDCCCCGHDHDHGEAEEHALPKWIVSAVLFVLILLFEHLTAFPTPVYLVLYLIPYLLIGWKTLWTSAKRMIRGAVFDENFLMSLASVGAFCVGQFEEGAAVMLLYHLGEWLEDAAVGKTRASVKALMAIRPDTARIVCEEDGDTDEVPVEAVGVGALIEVRIGERIPLDGIIVTGTANLDTAALTGESLPRAVTAGDTVHAGCICMDGVLRIRVEKTAGASTVQRILSMAQNAASKKTRTEAFITRFSRVYTPIVVCAAVLLAIVPSLVTGQWSIWVHRALTFLVVSCPCALVISVPLTFFCGIGGASTRGILIKGSQALEALSKTEIVASDKTGTLTRGVFSVTEITPWEPYSTEELLSMAAHAEQYSSHPAAQGILSAYTEHTGLTPQSASVTDVTEYPGRGIRAFVDGTPVLCGNAVLLSEHGIGIPDMDAGARCIVHIAVESRYAGAIVLCDTLKEDARDAVRIFRENGVSAVHMLTGDHISAAKPIADALGLDGCHASLLPDDKMEIAAKLKASCTDGTLLCIGDGINDAPLLAMADVGCAMGALGSDAAMEAADVVIMDDSPKKAAEAIALARKTMRIARQNIVFALGVKGVILVLGAIGITGMWAAVFGDVGVCMLCILNAARAHRK
ncbi:MAG: cadmium-translocating P-type ATPase [Ruminococcaceae bacterium]|nr:cadmium-translocating P-type ATPase [Oscillospiraceae bacterium]